MALLPWLNAHKRYGAHIGANHRIARQMRGRQNARGLPFVLSRLVVVIALLAVGGFLHFIGQIPKTPLATAPKAESIVVLTGGQDRITEAIRLLEKGSGQRLLISGVNPDITDTQLGEVAGADLTGRLACCVDVDRVAENTLGNATETAAWIGRNGYSSLIVVTSAYHMPRSLRLLEKALPGVTLVPYPVFTDSLEIIQWWRHPATLRVLWNEYAKYLATLVYGGIKPHR